MTFERHTAAENQCAHALDADGGDHRIPGTHTAPVAAVREDSERHVVTDAQEVGALEADGGGQSGLGAHKGDVAAVRTDLERQRTPVVQGGPALEVDGGDQANADTHTANVVAVPEFPAANCAATSMFAPRRDDPNFPGANKRPTPTANARRDEAGSDQPKCGTQGSFVAPGPDLSAANGSATPRTVSRQNGAGGDQAYDDAQAHFVAPDPAAIRVSVPTGVTRQDRVGDGHAVDDAQSANTVADLPAARLAATPSERARQDGNGSDHSSPDTQSGPVVPDPTIPLRLAADTLLDVERLRIATDNRIRALSDISGWTLTPAALRWESHSNALQDLEKQVTRELERAVKQHPLGPFVQSTVGLGLKQAGRLIGAIGDPSWNSLEQRPRRGPAELWAFCGYVPGQKRRKGVRSNWNADAKMRAYLVAESCVKQRHSPYRAIYDAARIKHAEAIHVAPCTRCGPSGHPAPEGSPLSDGHKHARALREVAKAVLRDLWVEAMRLRGEA